MQAGSGLRQCELLALTTSDVSLSEGTIKVDKQLDRYIPWGGRSVDDDSSTQVKDATTSSRVVKGTKGLEFSRRSCRRRWAADSANRKCITLG